MKRAERLSIASTASLFLGDRRAQGFKPKTLEFYHDRLKVFARWCEGAEVTALDDLTPAVIRRYFASMIEAGCAQGTQNCTGRAIRTFCFWCVAEGLLDANPLLNVKIPQPPREVLPPVSSEDIRKLLTVAPDERARALVLFLLDTGVRVSELCALNAGDIDLATGQVFVRSGKGGKTRIVYVSSETMRALMRYLKASGWVEGDEPLWRNQVTGERLQPPGVRQTLKTMAVQVGARNVTPHAFRRAHALLSLRAGVSLHTLARGMGHADIHVLKRYLALTDEDVSAAHKMAAIVPNLLNGKTTKTRIAA